MAYYHLFWDDTTQRPYVIKSGFNFFAFFFGFLYFIYHRAWISAAAFFSASIAIVIIQTVFHIPEMVQYFMSLAFNLYIGFDASDCLLGEYCRKKYRYLTSNFYASKDYAVSETFKMKAL